MGKKKTAKKKQDTKPNYPEVQEIIGKSKDNDEEQRRSTRLGALLEIVAFGYTICNISWKCLKKMFFAVPQTGILFLWLRIGFSIIFAIELIVFCYIVYLQMLCVYMTSSLVINAKYSNGWEKLEYIAIIILFSIMFLMLLYMCRGEITKEKVWNTLKKYSCKFVILAFVSSLCLVFVINTKTATINVLFETDGQIVLQNSSWEFEYNMQIEIYDSKGVVYKDNIEISDEDIPNLLRSREEVYDMSANTKDKNEKKDNNVIPEKEQLYWKYIIDLNDDKDKKLEEGKTYYLVITVDHDKKSYEIVNQFYKVNDQYVFCTENITKTY